MQTQFKPALLVSTILLLLSLAGAILFVSYSGIPLIYIPAVLTAFTLLFAAGFLFSKTVSFKNDKNFTKSPERKERGLELFQNPVVEVYNGRISAVNSAFHFLSGFNEKHIIGMSIEKILPDVHTLFKWPCNSRLKDSQNNTHTICINCEQHEGLMLFILNDKRDAYFLSAERRAEIDATITNLTSFLFNSSDISHSIRAGTDLISKFLGNPKTVLYSYADNVFCPVTAIDPDVSSFTANEKAASMIPEWEITKETGVYIAPRVVGSELRNLLGEKVNSYYFFLLEDGEQIWGALEVEYKHENVLPDEDLNVLRIASDLFVSTFSRHLIQQRLKSREEVFSMLTETINEAFVIYTPSRKSYKYLSPAIENLFQVPVLQILDNSDHMHQLLDKESSSLLDSLYREERTHKGNEKHLLVAQVNGIEKIIECRLYTIGDFTGSEHRIIGILNDVTRQIYDQQKLAQAARQEVEIGRRIQQMLLLDEPENRNPGLDIQALTRPSREIDGDFYNFLHYSMDTIDVILGDVMGKGIPAALIGAAAKSSFLKSLSALLLNSRTRTLPSPTDIVSFSRDTTIEKLIDLEQFITLTYIRIQYDLNRFEFVDCGNTPIIHYRKSMNQCFLLKGANMPVGFSKDEEYVSHIMPFEEGDIFLLFSDGVSEAVNTQGESFDIEGITSYIKNNAGQPSEEIVSGLEKELVAYCGRDTFADDITNLAVKVSSIESPFEYKNESFSPGLEELGRLREFILKSLDFDNEENTESHRKQVMAFTLACNEAFTNIVRHADTVCDSLNCCIRIHKKWYSMELMYQGKRFSWIKGRTPDVNAYQETGYGLYLIEQAVDSIVYTSADNDTRSILLSMNL